MKQEKGIEKDEKHGDRGLCSRQKRERERSPGGIDHAAQGTARKRGRL